MSIELRRVERTVQIVVAKPLAWALYACGMVAIGLARASLRGVRSLLRTEPPAANGAEPKEGAWQRQS